MGKLCGRRSRVRNRWGKTLKKLRKGWGFVDGEDEFLTEIRRPRVYHIL